MKQPPVILDFDGSVLPLTSDELRIPLSKWQEKIRFGCRWPAYSALANFLRGQLPEDPRPVFLGSGDYHHVSLQLLRNLAETQAAPPASLDLVVLDNHPDNMRYPFGLHCGSWVRQAAAHSCVRQVYVLGITSSDISLKHAWENYLGPFLRRKLNYWSILQQAGWLKALGRGDCVRAFDSAEALVAEFLPVLKGMERVYLSLDKDVFSKLELETDWDQGYLRFTHLQALLKACAGRLAGCDICGEISENYLYKNRFKRLLSRLDGQTWQGERHRSDPAELERLQELQRDFNLKILGLLRNL